MVSASETRMDPDVMSALNFAAAGCVFACGLQAHAATFHSEQILIMGSPLVAASGINDAGTIIGATSNGQSVGFVLQGSTLSFIQSGFPSAINRRGVVTGVTNTGTGFLWQNGAIVQAVSFPLGVFNGAHLTPVLNRHDELAFSSGTGNMQIANAGHAGHFHALKGLSPQSAIVSSINDSGAIAGYERATIQGQLREVVFVGQHGLFNMLVPQSGQNVIGGFVNDAGQVAYTDTNTGYVYRSGTTTSFSVPSPSFNVQVQAINNTGRVVGTYTDTSTNPAMQHVFLYNGSTVSSFGSYGATDSVQASLNDHGVMVVSDMVNNQPFASYRVTCSGTGC